MFVVCVGVHVCVCVCVCVRKYVCSLYVCMYSCVYVCVREREYVCSLCVCGCSWVYLVTHLRGTLHLRDDVDTQVVAIQLLWPVLQCITVCCNVLQRVCI